MDIYDAGLLGNNGRSGTDTPDPTGATKTELDQNVEKMVGNISTWWSGIAKKSQESINQARQQVESQGGIVNYAKSNYAKIESSIADAQKRAREQSSGEAIAESTDTPIASTDKGKQRAVDDQPTETTLASPSLGSSVSTLFSKLTADPRLQQLQKSLTTTLQSVSNPQQEQLNEDGTPRSPAVNCPVKLQESLAKLSLTFQSHLPHLDFKESQQLATKYLHATENFAKEIQTDMTDLVGELVRIVPPEGEAAERKDEVQAKEKQTEAAAPKAAAETTAAADADEEDFVWDEEDEETAAAATKADAEAKPSQPEEKKTTPSADAEDEDSDWE